MTTEQTTVTVTFTVTLEQVGKLTELAEALGRKKSDIVRQAIDELYARYQEASQDSPQ